MTGLDWAVVAVLALSVLSAARRGFFVEAFSLAGLLLGLPLAAWNYHRLVPYFEPWLRSVELADVAAYLAVALGVMAVAGLVGRLIRWSARSVGLGWADRLLGAGFGLVKGAVLATLAVLALAAFAPAVPWVATTVRGSTLAPYLLGAARTTALLAPGTLSGRMRRGLRELHAEQEGWSRNGRAE
jgi:membrane protein required for colicin V production